MKNIGAFFTKINVRDLIKLFNFQIAIAIFCVFIIFRGLFSQIILKIVFKFTKNHGKVKESELYKVLNRFWIFLGGYLALKMFKFSPQAVANINTIFRIIFIIFTASIVNSFITKDARWFRKMFRRAKNDVVNNFICKIIRGIVWVVAGYIIIKELGYDLTGLVAGLGVGSVIISLAAQDTVKSLLSGVVILTDKPFEIGDYIQVGNYQGAVIDITFRSTRIRVKDNSIVTIPNAIITTEYVVNWSKLKCRRLDFVLNLSMETTSDKIRSIVEKLKFVLKNNPDVDPETVQVNLDAISSYSSDILIFMYINEIDYLKYLAIKERIYCDILELVERENIELAYPTQTVYVKNTEKEDV